MNGLFVGVAFLVVLYSLIATVSMGRSQDKAIAGEYDRNTKQNFFRMTLIYAVTFILVMIVFVIFLLLR